MTIINGHLLQVDRQTLHACLVTVCILAPLDWTRTGGSCPGWTMRHASAATEKKSVASICLVIDHHHRLDTEPQYSLVHGVWSRHHHGLGDRSVVTLHWFLTLTSSSRFQLQSTITPSNSYIYSSHMWKNMSSLYVWKFDWKPKREWSLTSLCHVNVPLWRQFDGVKGPNLSVWLTRSTALSVSPVMTAAVTSDGVLRSADHWCWWYSMFCSLIYPSTLELWKRTFVKFEVSQSTIKDMAPSTAVSGQIEP